jgi:hypothetical protein
MHHTTTVLECAVQSDVEEAIAPRTEPAPPRLDPLWGPGPDTLTRPAPPNLACQGHET